MKIKKLFLISICLLLFGLSYSSANNVLGIWGEKAGGNGEYNGNSSAIDINKNIYVIGNFQGTTSIFGTSLTSSGNKDVFLAKLDDDKNPLRVKKGGGTDIDNISAVTVDNSGYVYVAGSFTSEADIFGVHVLSTQWYDSDIFLAKLDTNGNTVRVKTNTGTKNDYAKNIKVDVNGNIYVLGEFENTANIFGVSLTSDGAALDIFLAKLDSNGDAIRAKKTGNDKHNYALDIAFYNDNIYVAGVFQSTTTIFGGPSLDTTQRWDSDVFVTKLSSTGTVIRAKKGGNDVGESVKSLTVNNGYIYIVGGFTGTANMFGATLTSSGGSDGYLSKLDANGNNVLSKSFGGTNNDVVISASIDNDGNIYLVGNFEGTVNSFGEQIVSSGGSDIFVSKLNTSGIGMRVEKVGGVGNDSASSISLNNEDNVYVVGKFAGTADIFGTSLTSAGSTDLFLSKLLPFSAMVIIPDTTNTNTIANEFTSKGYIESGDNFIGSKAISLINTDGNIPTSLNIKNQNIKLSFSANTQFKKADNITNYSGIISAPIIKSVNTVNSETVLSAFKVGSSLESIKLTGGVATLSIPVPGETIGNTVQVYYSEDNGVNWYPQTTTTVTNIGGEPYVEFTTNHFTDFAVTLPEGQGGGSFTGTFVINNDAASTSSTGVTLNMSTTPAATHMRFSDDGSSRSSRETYATSKSRTLPGTYGTKTVYVQFDANNDSSGDAQTSDSINYSMGGCIGGVGEACLSLEITAVTGECRYGVNLDLGDHTQTYNAFTITGAFTGNNGTYPLRRSCNDTAGKAPWNMQISSTNLLVTGTSYSIPNTAIEMKTSASTKYRGSTSFTGLVGAFASRGTDLSNPRKIFEKTSPAGTVGEIGTDTVNLRVLVPTNQEVGAYQATITIAYPQM
ncbi:MAG: hypothetical protein WAZ12_00670 [Candidatus Absconditicoccaceae bacterium]